MFLLPQFHWYVTAAVIKQPTMHQQASIIYPIDQSHKYLEESQDKDKDR